MQNNAQRKTPIERNSFALIEATTRDNRKRILELAEEMSFHSDPDVCAKARSDLTNPTNRLSAEMSWLPCVSPKRSKELLDILKSKPANLLQDSEIEPLARANLLASAMEIIDEELSIAEWKKWILKFSEIFEEISSEKTLRHINEDRVVSGFPEITNIDLINKELAERRHVYNESIKQALNRLPTDKLLEVITAVVDTSTNSGNKQATRLIDDIVDKYQIETEGHLQAGAEKVARLIEGARKAAAHGESELMPVIQAIERSVRDWDRVAQPIQLSFKSRGLDHDLSVDLGFSIRSLAIDITNEHKLLEPTTRLANLLKEVFAELPEFSARLEDDMKTLDDMNRQNDLRKQIGPIVQLCEDAVAAAEREPKSASQEVKKLAHASKATLGRMKESGFKDDILDEGRDLIAASILECAITYGNETAKWADCGELLDLGEEFTVHEDLKIRYRANRDIVRKNSILFGKPCGSPPSLATINTIGFTLYGATDPDPTTGSHIATYYFVVLMIPIFPISRYRIIQNGNSYRFLGKFPLRPFDKWHLGVALAIVCIFILTNM